MIYGDMSAEEALERDEAVAEDPTDGLAAALERDEREARERRDD